MEGRKENFEYSRASNKISKKKKKKKNNLRVKIKNFRDQGAQNGKLNSHEEAEEYTYTQRDLMTHAAVDEPIGV